MLISLENMDSSYLTFESNNVRNYRGEGVPFDVFGFSALTMNISLFIDNSRFYGHLLDSSKRTYSEYAMLVCTRFSLLVYFKTKTAHFVDGRACKSSHRYVRHLFAYSSAHAMAATCDYARL